MIESINKNLHDSRDIDHLPPLSPEKETEVLVLGGGPAGATAATILAQAGHQVLVVEREKFPRFHIGESFMPDTYWILRRLGMLDKMKTSQFVRKYSVQFVNDSGKESQPFYFFENNPHECSQTWQVVRSEFDQMMLNNAREYGAEVREETRVIDVQFDGESVKAVRVQNPDSSESIIRAKVVVDASGQSSIIANRLKIRESDNRLKKASIWAYFKGAKREPAKLDEGATLVLQTKGKKGWFWYIPQHNDIVSVGVVSDLNYLFEEKLTPEEIFAREVENCPSIKSRIEGSERVTNFFTTKDFSYRSKKVAGPNWTLIGDAFGFLDPIYSSGLQLAFRSGAMAADAISAALKTDIINEQKLREWEPAFLQGMNRLRNLVYAFYEGFSFGAFIRRFPEHQRHITDLLIGDVFKEGLDEVWEPMALLQEEMKNQEAMQAVMSKDLQPIAV